MKYFISEKRDAAFHLALEELLFNQSDQEYLLVYRNTPSVIIGQNQVAQNEVNIDFCHRNNIGIFRRISGGGAVYHDLHNINYAFIVHKSSSFSGMNGAFLKPVIQTLQQLNIPAFVGDRKQLLLPGNFKISGTASHVKGMRELHHGTLLYNTQLDMLLQSLQSKNINLQWRGVRSVPSPTKNIRQFLEEQSQLAPDTEVFCRLFTKLFIQQCGVTETHVPSQEQLEAVELVAEEKFRSSAWTYKK